MKSTKVISVINYKGGVGKTSVCHNLAYELSRMDNKVLMIDFDGQGNLTKFTSENDCMDKNIISMLDKVMIGEEKLSHPVVNVSDNLDIIGCNIEKESWMNRALSILARETILKRYIDILKEELEYDYIMIDNAPSVNLDFQNSLVASDFYLIVTETKMASTDGIYTIERIISQIKKHFNPKLKSAGIVINKSEERTHLHKLIKEFIDSVWQEDMYIYENNIPKSVVAGECEVYKKSVGSYKKDSKIAKAYMEFAKEFERVVLNA